MGSYKIKGTRVATKIEDSSIHVVVSKNGRPVQEHVALAEARKRHPEIADWSISRRSHSTVATGTYQRAL